MYKISNADRAQVLIQALPYIQKYSGQTIVVKYGGNAMVTPELKDAVMSDIVLMQLVGVNVVLVHGGCVVLKAWHIANENPVKSIKSE